MGDGGGVNMARPRYISLPPPPPVSTIYLLRISIFHYRHKNCKMNLTKLFTAMEKGLGRSKFHDFPPRQNWDQNIRKLRHSSPFLNFLKINLPPPLSPLSNFNFQLIVYKRSSIKFSSVNSINICAYHLLQESKLS